MINLVPEALVLFTALLSTVLLFVNFFLVRAELRVLKDWDETYLDKDSQQFKFLANRIEIEVSQQTEKVGYTLVYKET